MSPPPLDVKERLRLRAVEILVVLALVFLGVRIALPRFEGRAVLEREARVLNVLEAIHAGEGEAAAADGRMIGLRELVDASDPESPLRGVSWRTAPQDVDLLEGHGYLFALYRPDPGRADDRAWSSRQASGEEPEFGYAAFAWPARYGEDSQWAFFVDHRGKLLGSWNHAGLLDGTNEPFPPAVHPLRDYLSARKEGEDAEWFLFAELKEILPPPPPPGAGDG